MQRETRSTTGKMALQVKRVGQYGPHAAAKNAGFQQGDLLIAYDGRRDLLTETALLNYALSNLTEGDKVTAIVQRNGKEISLQLPIQP